MTIKFGVNTEKKLSYPQQVSLRLLLRNAELPEEIAEEKTKKFYQKKLRDLKYREAEDFIERIRKGDHLEWLKKSKTS